MKSNLLKELDSLPAGILDASATELYRILPQPSLIHLQGRNKQPVFVSVLLHGNEVTGLLAMQTLLKKYLQRELPRSISIFFGNIDAARFGVRKLDNQPDYNRVWPGTEQPNCEETRMTQQIVDSMQQRNPFLSIDIHNNTGLNPHYACVNKLDDAFLHLATLFGRMVVYFIHPKGVQSAAMATLCPAVTLECGKPGVQYGVEHAAEYLDSCLHLSAFPSHPIASQDIDLFHTVAQVSIRDDITFSFNDTTADLALSSDIERMNFTEINNNTEFGSVNHNTNLPFISVNEHGEDISGRYFKVEQGKLLSAKSVMPAMLTLDEQVIRQDCLCYLMERIQLK